jgi:hypothetical protein
MVLEKSKMVFSSGGVGGCPGDFRAGVCQSAAAGGEAG